MSEKALALLRPELPTASELLPYLERIDAAGWFTNFGPLSQQLETELARMLGGGEQVHVASAASGTLALELALSALHLPAGSRVLLPSLTFPATATAVKRAGLVPMFADVDSQSWALEPVAAQAEAERVAAVLPVAIFGRAADALAWDAFTESSGIPVVIDAAGAFGNQTVGRSTAAVFSMHATKAFASGEGGFVASPDAEVVRRVRVGSNFGFDLGSVQHAGTNAKLSEYHAAIALAALESWGEAQRRRLQLAEGYAEALLPLSDRISLHEGGQPWVRSVFVVQLHSGVTDPIIAKLGELGIETRRWYWPPVHEHPAFSACERGDELSVTDSLSKQLLGLPFHLQLEEDAPQRVADALDKVLA